MQRFHFYFNSILSLLLLLTRTVTAAESRSILLTFPPPAGQGSKTIFNAGQDVHFTWTSTFPTISLQVWQGPDDAGHVRHANLLTNVTNATQDYIWSAHTLPPIPRKWALHLYLFNAEDPDCAACSSNSSNFFLLNGNAAKAMQRTNDLKLGLGIGLGIPMLIALTGLTTWVCLRRRRSHRRADEPGPGMQEEPLAVGKASSVSARTTSGASRAKGRAFTEADGKGVTELESDRAAVLEAPEQRELAELEGGVIERPLNQ